MHLLAATSDASLAIMLSAQGMRNALRRLTARRVCWCPKLPNLQMHLPQRPLLVHAPPRSVLHPPISQPSLSQLSLQWKTQLYHPPWLLQNLQQRHFLQIGPHMHHVQASHVLTRSTADQIKGTVDPASITAIANLFGWQAAAHQLTHLRVVPPRQFGLV